MPAKGVIDLGNSTNKVLDVDEVFTGKWMNVVEYATIIISLSTDKPSAIDGLCVQHSSDAVNIDGDDNFSIPANAGKVFTFMPNAEYYRIVYTNGSALQTYFRMQCVLKMSNTIHSSHRIQDSIISDDDASLVKSVITALNEATGVFENITSFNGAINVGDGLTHKAGVDRWFTKDVGAAKNPSAPITAGDTVIGIAVTAGWAAEDLIQITEDSSQEFTLLKIMSVIADTSITVNRPVDSSYTVAATIQKVTNEMAVSGTPGSPQIFQVMPPAGQKWQLLKVQILLICDSDTDDTLFGNIEALTNGLLIKSKRGAIERVGTVWYSNGDIRLDAGIPELLHTEEFGTGLFGVGATWTFVNMGFILEIDGDDSDYVQAIVQDALTDLVSFRMKAHGRIFGV